MATFNKFYSFVEALSEKVHNLGSDTLTVALTNTLPVNTNTQLSNITQIAYTNLSTRVLAGVTSAQTTGTYTLTGANAALVRSIATRRRTFLVF